MLTRILKNHVEAKAPDLSTFARYQGCSNVKKENITAVFKKVKGAGVKL